MIIIRISRSIYLLIPTFLSRHTFSDHFSANQPYSKYYPLSFITLFPISLVHYYTLISVHLPPITMCPGAARLTDINVKPAGSRAWSSIHTTT